MPTFIENNQVVFGASKPAQFAKLLRTLKPDLQLFPMRLLDDDGKLIFEADDYQEFQEFMDELEAA